MVLKLHKCPYAGKLNEQQQVQLYKVIKRILLIEENNLNLFNFGDPKKLSIMASSILQIQDLRRDLILKKNTKRLEKKGVRFRIKKRWNY